MEKPDSYFPFWNGLTGEQKTLLSNSLQERRFGRGDIIHSGSDDCIGLLLVIDGRLRVYTLSEEGKELTLYRLYERDMCLFSASCVMPDIQFDVMVSAELDTRVLIIPSNVHKKLMGECAAVANYTSGLMASRFSDVMWLIDQIQNKKLDSRLAAFLLEESALNANAALDLTHEQIARHLGSMREVITRMLKYFQDEGLVKLGRGSVTLLDAARLTALASKSLK